MQLWTMGNKLLALAFIMASAYFADGTAAHSSLLMLLALLYIALSMSVRLLGHINAKTGAIAAVILFVLAASAYGSPLFVLLLPFSACELAFLHGRRRAMLQAGSLLPLLFLRDGLLVGYVFVAVAAWFHYLLYSAQLMKAIGLEEELDRLRMKQERLARRLSDGQELQRNSEYTHKLEERNRLSQEIHDGVGHSMTGALIQMEAAKMLLARDPERAGQLLDNAIGISKGAIEEIRLTLHRLKPPTEQLGMSRLREKVESFGMSSGLQAGVSGSGDLESIGPLYWKIIQDNVTESLTNALKYSGATAVHVEVSVLKRYIKAVVTDNGRGKDKIVKGLGLKGMEERAASVGGTVVADGSRGFSVTTLLPCGEKPSQGRDT
ncbi:sensor histidine kinase [Paenibacillus sp. D51F]